MFFVIVTIDVCFSFVAVVIDICLHSPRFLSSLPLSTSTSTASIASIVFAIVNVYLAFPFVVGNICSSLPLLSLTLPICVDDDDCSTKE
ncbi:hypothetical protein J3A83DRAFT_1165310 [Scleroderma citrinum]